MSKGGEAPYSNIHFHNTRNNELRVWRQSVRVARACLTEGGSGRYVCTMEADVHIKADNLGIMRGERVLFRDVSLQLGAGEVVLLRGANGAGKTTLLRCLAGLTRPETGTVSAEPFHWVSHRSGVKPHETPIDHLYTWAGVFGTSKPAVPAVAKKMGLERAQHVAGVRLSAGQRRRTALGRTLLQHRPIWLLDEPFAALDTGGRALLLDMIAEHRAGGGSVIAAVHGDVNIPAAHEVSL